MAIKKKSKAEKFIIVGRGQWVNTSKPNPSSKKFQADIVVDTDTKIYSLVDKEKTLIATGPKEIKEFLEEHGLGPKTDRDGNVKKDESGNYFIGVKSNFPPRVFDAKRNEITDTNLVIGNGSTISLLTSIYSGRNEFGKFSGLAYQGVQIINLIHFSNSLADIFDEQEGFESSEKKAFTANITTDAPQTDNTNPF